MTGTRHPIRRGILRRRWTAALALVAYLAASVGVPVPAPKAASGGVPFPCQDHECGCATAEQCWRSCCCHTVEERWAWARARNIEPPACAEKPAEASWRVARLRDREAASTRKSCCSEGHSCCEPEAKPVVPKPEMTPRWQWTSATLRCRGVAETWTGASVSLPPPIAVAWIPFPRPVGWLGALLDIAETVPVCPPIPPPRAA